MAASTLVPSLLFVAVVVCGGSGAVGAMTALEDVCLSLGGNYVTPELCASALCYDTSSPCRDAHAVAVLEARLAAANGTAARDSIQAAASNNSAATGEDVKAGLRSCVQLYTGAVAALKWAAGSVAAGRYSGAREVLDAAQYVNDGCNGMARAAMPRENDGFSSMVFVAYAVLASLSKGY